MNIRQFVFMVKVQFALPKKILYIIFMKNIDWFNFEDKTLDFPIYKKDFPISKIAWVILFILIFVGFMLTKMMVYFYLIMSIIIGKIYRIKMRLNYLFN